MNPVEAAFVVPYYQKMMGCNGRNAMRLWPALAESARVVTVDDVSYLLRTALWRPVVMGAWFSLVVPAEEIRDDLLAAMARSRGSLTAPPLATAATVVAGARAVPAMTAYLDFIMDRPDGSQDFVAAAMEHVGAEPPIVPGEERRQMFRDLLGVALRLRATARSPE